MSLTDLHQKTIILGDCDLCYTTKVTELNIFQFVHACFISKHLCTTRYTKLIPDRAPQNV